MVLTAAHCTHQADKGMPFNASEGKILSEGLKDLWNNWNIWAVAFDSFAEFSVLQ